MGLNRKSKWKFITIWISWELLLFNFERLDISKASIIHPSQKLWSFEFVESFLVQIWVSPYMMGLNHTPESKVMAVPNCLALPCSISSFSIYHGPQSYTRVKSYSHLSLSCASMFHFERIDILWAWIGHPSEMLWPFKFLESSVVQFRASRFIMGLNHTTESKVMAIWICRELSFSNLSVSIYDGP